MWSGLEDSGACAASGMRRSRAPSPLLDQHCPSRVGNPADCDGAQRELRGVDGRVVAARTGQFEPLSHAVRGRAARLGRGAVIGHADRRVVPGSPGLTAKYAMPWASFVSVLADQAAGSVASDVGLMPVRI